MPVGTTFQKPVFIINQLTIDTMTKSLILDLTDTYPGFEYSAHLLHKFIFAVDIFTILLKDGKIVHHRATDTELFRDWLIMHRIEDIKPDQIEF